LSAVPGRRAAQVAADSNSTLSNDQLNALSDRLCAHSESITNAERRDIANDLLLAATAMRRLVT
jgi:hypothetical protein